MALHHMKSMDTYEANIQNLTDLWEAMGATADEPESGPALHVSKSWPDRQWFRIGARPEHADALRLIEGARAAARTLILPVWCRGEAEPFRRSPAADGWGLTRQLHAAGFTVAFEQTLMDLNLAGWSPSAVAGAEVDLQDVGRDTRLWAEVASRSFGYTVPAGVTDDLIEHAGVRLVMARQDGQPVGTGLLYAQGEIVGLHMIGVLPDARRKGIARKIMLRLLEDARAQGFGLATLQASAMGEGLYRKLGFKAQGRILNFQWLADEDHPTQALLVDQAHEAIGARVPVRGPGRCADRLDSPTREPSAEPAESAESPLSVGLRVLGLPAPGEALQKGRG